MKRVTRERMPMTIRNSNPMPNPELLAKLEQILAESNERKRRAANLYTTPTFFDLLLNCHVDDTPKKPSNEDAKK
jgi:hypothetical protein